MWAIVLSGLGGIIPLIAAIIFIGRSIFKQVDSTDKNTHAIQELSGKIESLMLRMNNHETRIAILEDRINR